MAQQEQHQQQPPFNSLQQPQMQQQPNVTNIINNMTLQVLNTSSLSNLSFLSIIVKVAIGKDNETTIMRDLGDLNNFYIAPSAQQQPSDFSL